MIKPTENLSKKKMASRLFERGVPQNVSLMTVLMIFLAINGQSSALNHSINKCIDSNAPDSFLLNCSHGAVISIDSASAVYLYSDMQKGNGS